MASGLVGLVVLVLLPLGGCAECDKPAPPAERPNVLWIVWDTVRADHLSLYGYEKPTTPKLAQWAAAARVYENCISAASYTVPAHASMFTGLLPPEHGANNAYMHLDARFVTLAELLGAAGYETYMFSANPNVTAERNLTQGFDVVEHPWGLRYRDRALQIVTSKIAPHDRSTELADALRSGRLGPWNIKACGELAQTGVASWLQQRDPRPPFFAFINYMEAHRPLIPPEEHRRRVMTPEQVRRSYEVDRSWLPSWEYTFGLRDYTDEELAVIAGTYDAAVAELDDMTDRLLKALEAGGHLKNTVVIVTSDHGEHLGEQHMLDHQFSVYQALLNIPLVVHYPPRLAAGRDARPVLNSDLFPTLLELTGVAPPPDLRTQARSLLAPQTARPRFAACPSYLPRAIRSVQAAHPDWNPQPWLQGLQAYFDGPYKLIAGAGGRRELYQLERDPGERENLLGREVAVAQRLEVGLRSYLAGLNPAPTLTTPLTGMSEEQRKRLEALGYLGGGPDDGADYEPTSAPASTSRADGR